MFTRIRFSLAGVTLVFVLTACGGNSGFITTQQALKAFRQAGFTRLIVRSNRKAYTEFARKHPGPLAVDAKQALDADTIWTGGANWPFVPLLAVRLPSTQYAKKTYANDTPTALRAQVEQVRRFHILPAGFSLDKLKIARVCNVVVSSYNADRSAITNARFSRAVKLLQGEC